MPVVYASVYVLVIIERKMGALGKFLFLCLVMGALTDEHNHIVSHNNGSNISADLINVSLI